MLNSPERMDYIRSYLSAYENSIIMANKQGLFDAAKLFELFAENVCTLWFGQPFSNLNISTSTFPIVDLISEDQTLYVQVSTAQDAGKKVRDTLVKLRDSTDKRVTNVQKIVFFFLHNHSVDHIPDYIGDSMIGRVSFIRKEHLISTHDILGRARNDLDFQIQLFDLLKKDEYISSGLHNAFHKALTNSKDAVNGGIDCQIARDYHIDRSSLITQIKTDDHRFISIQGSAGSGKSALCKLLLQEESMVLYARAERFSEETNLDNVWSVDIEKVLTYLNGQKLTFFIDALEFISDCRKTTFELLQQLYFIAQKFENIYIVTSCRSSDKNAFIELETKLGIQVYLVQDLSDAEILPIAEKYPVISKMRSMKAYASLLCIPFYINLILNNSVDPDDIQDAASFREFIWNHVICLKEKAKEYNASVKITDVMLTVNTIVFERAKQGLLGVHARTLDSLILRILISEGVVILNNNLVRLRHDIFEDICFEQYFDEKFHCCRGNYQKFYEDIKLLGACAYRRYQIWISNKLLAADDRVKFLHRIVFTDTIPADWKEQTLIGIVKSKYCSDFFYEQGADLVGGNQIWDFIRAANLYAFDVDIVFPSNSEPMLRFYPIGNGRPELIRLVHTYHLYQQPSTNVHEIKKLCQDFAKQQEIDIHIATKAGSILTYYVDGEVNTYLSDYYSKFIDIVSLDLSAIYQMSNACKDWILVFWSNISDFYKSNDREKERLAKDVIRWTIKNAPYKLVRELHKDLYAFAELFWTYPKAKYDPYEDRLDRTHLYGLNKQADSYRHDYRHAEDNYFLWFLFSAHLFDSIDWAISFVNRAFSKFAESNPDQVATVQIYFADKNQIKTYLGNPGMWLAISEENTLPIVISDIIYILTCTIINLIKSSLKCGLPVDVFANRVKQLIYSKANNIALLTVIESIAMHFKDELPGYGQDLASSLHLIYWDIQRHAYLLDDPTRRLLIKQILLATGVPNLEQRYKTAPECKCTLQDYVFALQFDADEIIKDSCHKMLDYLYQKAASESWSPKDNLQIQRMDARNAAIVSIDDHTEAYVPRIKGKAAKYVHDHISEEPEGSKPLLEKIFSFTDMLSKGTADVSDAHALIDEVIVFMHNLHDDPTSEHMLMLFVATILKDTRLDSERRSALCQIWVNGIRRFFSNGSFSCNNILCPILFQQVYSNVSTEVKNEIKLLMLDLLFDDYENGIISEIAAHAKDFLANDKVLAHAMMYTIVKLAEDEMLHQKYNADYLQNHSDRPALTFVPNLTPNLSRVDRMIQHDGCQELYHSERNTIIKQYLYEASTFEINNLDIQNYDFGTLCHIVNCGVDISNPDFNSLVRKLISFIVEMLCFNHKKHRTHDILSSGTTLEITELYQRQMVASTANGECAIDTLFDGIAFDKFTYETIEFYQDIFSHFRAEFIDSWISRERRQSCIRKIEYLEQKVIGIDNSYVKEALFKSLIFYRKMIIPINPNEYTASYTYADICFLNQQFSKYGAYHLRDMLRTIYQLHISELLPHILVSIRDCFLQAKTDIKAFANTISKERNIVMLIIYKAFVKYRDEIKKDYELTEAYETVLESLIELGYENAAVLLDEFRLH